MSPRSFAPLPVSAMAGSTHPAYGNPSDWVFLPGPPRNRTLTRQIELPDGSMLTVIPADGAEPGHAASILARLVLAATAYEHSQIPAYRLTASAPASDAPTVPGTPFAGGFYAGRFTLDGNTYALVVAPKAEGERANIIWKKNWREATPGAQSVIDGFANTEAMNDAAHPAAQWARSLRIAGLDDWYLPARDELELLYRNLKPGTAENWTYASRLARYGAKPGQYNGCDDQGNGHNASSVPPGAAYTETSPAQTTAEAFREGGPEAFERRWYWSSTEFVSAYAWFQTFDVGDQDGVGKTTDLRARAVRKVLI